MDNPTPLINQLGLLLMGALFAIPGIYALYVGKHRDLEDTNMRLQLESYANEIRRLQALVDEKQRNIGELKVTIASLRSKLSAIGKAFKKLAEQLKKHNIEPALDADKLVELLDREE